MHIHLRRVLAGLTLAAGLATVSAIAQSGAVTVAIDVAQSRRPINPNVYGVAYATPAQLADLNAPLNRYGGNNTTRYNWQINADNRGQDLVLPEHPGSQRHGRQARRRLHHRRQERGRSASADHSRQSAGSRAWTPIGRSWRATPSPSTGRRPGTTGSGFPMPATASALAMAPRSRGTIRPMPTPRTTRRSQRGWINHLVTRWGVAANGGLKYYILDNEPSLWHETHRDVHATGATMEEVRDYMLGYAREVKNADPGASVIGPEEWGWLGTKLSGYDQQWGNTHGWPAWSSLPDRSSHGQMDYLPWLLQQVQQASAVEGRRLLDVFTSHYYPQGGEFSNDTSSTMQARRNKSTRSLWDPAYVDDSWIASVIRYIPQLRDWVNAVLPGHRDRHHRVQLGRRRAHQRRDDPGRPLRHLRSRGTRHGRAVDDAETRLADLQGDEDLPQL